MSESTIFAKRMKETREQSGLKQKELAEKVGVTPQTISAYEKGGKTPTLDNASAIAKELGVSLDWLCGIGEGASSKGMFETLGDVARFLHEMLTWGNIWVHQDFSGSLSIASTPKICLEFNDTEISNFLTDDSKMRDLLYSKTFSQEFYDRWILDRIHSLDDIKIDEYLKDICPF